MNLNSILTYEKWINRWKTPMERMLTMALPDNPRMIAREGYITWERGGMPLAPGKH